MNLPVKKFLSGSALKWIAIVVMLIDHIGASGLVNDWTFRQIGRTAFPLFCFLLAEGAVHTKNIRKYLGRLAVFAVISEIPFDLAIFGLPFYWGHQNVYWTLLLGLVVIYLFQKFPAEGWKGGLGVAALAALAEVCVIDYGATGVVVITLMYLLREKPWMRFLICYGVLALSSAAELWCLPAFLLMTLYNGKRGWQPRYLFYGFYPVHLFLLWFLERFVLVMSW